MLESLMDFQTGDELKEDEYTMLTAFLNGAVEIAGLVPAVAVSDVFCRQAFEAYHRSHKRGESVDTVRLAAAMDGGKAHSNLLLVRDSLRADPATGLSIARMLRQRHEGAILAGELEANVSMLRYGFETQEAAARCQKALEQFQQAVGGREQETDIDSILRDHGDMILMSREEGGLPFNIPSLDKFLGGNHPGELITVAARPKRGKTSLLASLVEAANLRTVIFSLEMTALEFLKMLVCIHGRIPSDELRDRLHDVDAAKESLRRRKIDIVDTSGLTVDEISAACYARRGVQLIIVDYLQIIGRMRGAESARDSLVESIKSLKVLAKRLNATIITGSQIARTGDDKPSARDLAESDEILRSSDAVLVMKWKDDEPPAENRWQRAPIEVEISLTQRHGPSAKFPLAFHRSQRRFGELGIGDGPGLEPTEW
ncbi:MAG: AAA family ATPase [Planctomycetaceae bacterium]|nr:AAA family ATPase [Planctomycetaceae bacterium]